MEAKMIRKFLCTAFALASVTSMSAFCADEIDDNLDVNEIPAIRLGAKIPAVVYTNRNDGLTTYWKKKGKIYNDEKIIVSKTNIKGFSVTEDDEKYVEWRNSDDVTNICTSVFATNNNHKIIWYSYSDEPSAVGTADFDAYYSLVFLNDTDFTEDETAHMYNRDKISDSQFGEVYTATSFDARAAKCFDRVSTVRASLITDKASAIATFNTILAALKAQK